MSGTISATNLAALSAAALQNAKTESTSTGSAAAAASAGTTTATASGTAASSGSSALSSLTGDYNDFLSLLTTQLQDQDPSSPMDSDEFTSELVQFASVQQQVQSNTNLTQLIQLQQGQSLSSGAALIGKDVQVTGTAVPLENGSATIDFDATAAEPVAISITNSGGTDVKDVTVQATAGANSWTWNGLSNAGTQLPDGAYNVAVETGDNNGDTSAVPFTSVGIPTAVTKSADSISYAFGSGMSLDESEVGGLAQ